MLVVTIILKKVPLYVTHLCKNIKSFPVSRTWVWEGLLGSHRYLGSRPHGVSLTSVHHAVPASQHTSALDSFPLPPTYAFAIVRPLQTIWFSRKSFLIPLTQPFFNSDPLMSLREIIFSFIISYL